MNLKRCVGAILAVMVIAAPFGFAPRIQENDFVDLFDGRTLDGWEVRPSQETGDHWKVEDGLLIAENVNEEGSDLWTTKNYQDYELTLEYKTPSDYYDTGVHLRGNGHQVQIGISGSLQVDMTACIYAPKDKRGSYPGRSDKVSAFNRPGQWNRLRILMTGKRIQTFLNGEPFVDYQSVAINDEGPIGLQLHSGHHMKIFFKNIRVREIE